MISKFKDWALPIAMLVGGLFHSFISELAPLVPFLLFSMLFVTYCRLSVSDLRLRPLHIWLLLFQLLVSIPTFYMLNKVSPLVGQGGLICVLAPTANSAAVITAMLGGSLGILAAYTLFSNLLLAITLPILFPLAGIHANISFWDSFFHIIRQLIPMLILPLLVAYVLSKVLPRVHSFVREKQAVSFYLWAASLTIVTARTVGFLLTHGSGRWMEIGVMSLVTLLICIVQFWAGRKIGRRFNDVVSGGQALGQKNTVLAIWIAQAYMLPLASLGPASYILWQNSINTFQLWRHRRLKKMQG